MYRRAHPAWPPAAESLDAFAESLRASWSRSRSLLAISLWRATAPCWVERIALQVRAPLDPPLNGLSARRSQARRR